MIEAGGEEIADLDEITKGLVRPTAERVFYIRYAILAGMTLEKIAGHIWNYSYEGGSNVVDVYIRYLRKKIDEGQPRRLIHTVRGAGYVLREET